MTKANQEPRCIETVLEMDGIMAKGYGVVAKVPMRDTELKIKDKGLYAYLCAMSGGGVRTWPSRGKILADLQIGKDAFYSSLERLISLGYLSKTTRRLHGDSGMWTRTVYTIELNPKGRTCDAEEPMGDDNGSLTVEGMLGDGWGFAPRLVMTDPRLSIREKALYAYILTYAAVGKVAYPKVETIQYHLGISDKSYRDMMRQLCKLGYIVRRRRRLANGRMGCYDYYISQKPAIADENFSNSADTGGNENLKPPVPYPDTVKSDTEFAPDSDDYSPYTASFSPPGPKPDTVESDIVAPPGSKPDTVKPDTVPPGRKPDTVKSDIASPPGPKPDTAGPDTAKPDTAEPDTANPAVRKIQELTNTRLSITREDKNQPTTTTAGVGVPRPERERMNQILEAGGIPADCLHNKAELTEVLCTMTDRDWRKENAVFYLDEEKNAAYPVVMDALLRMCSQPLTKLCGLVVCREEIVEKLNRCCERDKYGLFLYDFVDVAVTDFVSAIQSRRNEGKTPVRNPVNYACSVIWSATETYQRLKWQEQQEECLY